MRYKITNTQLFILKWIAKKIVIQSYDHKYNIIDYYRVLNDAARDEFREDNKPTLDDFLSECHKISLTETPKF